MRKVDEQIKISDDAICKLIDTFGEDQRGFLSQSILDKLRTFVEAVSVKVSGEMDYNYDLFNSKAKNYTASMASTRFLADFHNFLKISKSHYATDEQASERLMLKYYEYLLKLKSYLKQHFDIDVLRNIGKFPVNTDNTLGEYYRKIVEKIDRLDVRQSELYRDRFYILKVKPFFVNHEVFYEITFRIADDKTRKFDRLIAFTRLEVSENYAVKLAILNDHIEIADRKMPIQVVVNWEVSIRPCEFKNFERVFDSEAKRGGPKNLNSAISGFSA